MTFSKEFSNPALYQNLNVPEKLESLFTKGCLVETAIRNKTTHANLTSECFVYSFLLFTEIVMTVILFKFYLSILSK